MGYIPSGKRLHYGKSPFLWAIFNSYVSLPEGIWIHGFHHCVNGLNVILTVRWIYQKMLIYHFWTNLAITKFGSSRSLCSCQNHTAPGPPGDSAATTPSSGAQSVGQIWGKNLNETPALGEMTYLHLQMCSPTSKRWPKFLDAQTRWLQVASYVSRGPGESTNVNNTLTAQPSDNLGRFPCLSPSICSLRFSYSPRWIIQGWF